MPHDDAWKLTAAQSGPPWHLHINETGSSKPWPDLLVTQFSPFHRICEGTLLRRTLHFRPSLPGMAGPYRSEVIPDQLAVVFVNTSGYYR